MVESGDVLFLLFLFKQKTAYEMLRSRVGSEMCIRDSGEMPRKGHQIIKRNRAGDDDLHRVLLRK